MDGRSSTDPAASAGAATASTATNISIDEMREKLVIDATTTASNPRAALTNVGLPDATGIWRTAHLVWLKQSIFTNRAG